LLYLGALCSSDTDFIELIVLYRLLVRGNAHCLTIAILRIVFILFALHARSLACVYSLYKFHTPMGNFSSVRLCFIRMMTCGAMTYVGKRDSTWCLCRAFISGVAGRVYLSYLSKFNHATLDCEMLEQPRSFATAIALLHQY
jgi:hypothetical protein